MTDRETSLRRRAGDVIPMPMPTLEDLMREGPGGYVPTPGRPGAPALNERIAIALLADREAATAECEAAAAQMDFAAALAARPRLDYEVVSVAACMARNKRRRAALVRAEAWRRISEARYVGGVEARRRTMRRQ